MRVLDLFSGIGGFSLGLERAGMKTVAFVEREPFCQRVLAKHWPEVPIYDDVKTYRGDEHECDVVCGGFPCQDISFAGRGAGLAGERSGLWSEMARIIGVARPRYVIVENVAALLGRGLGTVLGDLAAIGYDAEWHCIPASYVGAPHRRDRVWIIANSDSNGTDECWSGHGIPNQIRQCSQKEPKWDDQQFRTDGDTEAGAFADNIGVRIQRDSEKPLPRVEAFSWCENVGSIAELVGRSGVSQPLIWGSRDGIPDWVDRLRGIGNAVVPQIPEMIGRAILETADG